MKKIVLGIIGKIAAGKTTATEYLKEEYNAKSVRFSDSLGDALERFYLEKTRQNYQLLSKILRENFGQDLISKTVANDIENFDVKIVIAEGIRRPSDTEFLKAEYPNNFFMINIDTVDEIRYKRLLKRGEKPDDATKKWDDFKVEDQAESEKLIEEIAKTANFTINNNGNLDSLYKQIEEILNKIENEN